jgi:hypothetical protein
MGAADASEEKIICFRCRKSACRCPPPSRPHSSSTNAPRVTDVQPQASARDLLLAMLWLGGACVAGGAAGALLAFLVGGR